MTETDVLYLFLARVDNYSVTNVAHIRGRAYSVTMNGERYNAVVLPNSFSFYEKRYHLAKQRPDLVICFEHNSVLPIPVLSMKAGRLAQKYDLPTGITNVEKQRHRSKIGSQVLLGQYMCGMKEAQALVNGFEPTTRKRYLQRAKDLGKRRRGRPVDTQRSKAMA
jgi:hypothetical protein